MLHTSHILLSKGALHHNIQYMKQKAGKKARYSMVIKSNAYGHGIEDLVPLAEKCGVDHFSVFSTAEAQRANLVKSPDTDIMIMGFVDDDYLAWAVENDIAFYVFTLHRLRETISAATHTTKPARIHLELETGMHRTGFTGNTLAEAIRLIKDNSETIRLEGLCTHLAGAEHMTNYDRVRNQLHKFERLCNHLGSEGLQPKYRHVANSAGVLNFPEATLDLVRVGIANYGFWPSSETRMRHLMDGKFEKDPLKRVLSWKSQIMSVTYVDEGEWVSYGKSYRTNRPSQIATIPVGYGYGYSRELSNNGHVLVDGKRVPVVGTVNMNEMVIDVTDVKQIDVGTEVVLIGEQNGLSISVSAFGEMNKSMNYELLARLPHHIPRKMVE
jgi:alanine racemase